MSDQNKSPPEGAYSDFAAARDLLKIMLKGTALIGTLTVGLGVPLFLAGGQLSMQWTPRRLSRVRKHT